ncbi:copper resistance CopC/CopD family protein [Glycomyces xiaoerkulensis]|uniref:copper resistance CopC/CopD family protein n=1 Tax=Glycomyces xiaoerkulensis TaxID=2038139 RepID=UPI000C26AF3C|nr:copper resistance protein CopC [Glycomyces xiaoerkulensis]
MTSPATPPRTRAARPAYAVALLALGLLLAVLPATAARAHASLLSTDPADGAELDEAPSAVTLHFNEPVSPVEEAARLVDADGGEHPVTATAADDDVVLELPPGLGEGRFTLSWRVVSADGHPVAGAVSFSVDQGPAPAEPAETSEPVEPADPVVPVEPDSGGRAPVMAADALHYLGLLVFTGLVFFRVAIARQQRLPHPRHRVLGIAGVTAVAAAAAAVPIGALDRLGLPLSRVLDLGAWSDSSQAASVAIAAVTALGVGAAWWCHTRIRRSWSGPAALTAAAAALAAPVLIGHSRLFGPEWLMVGSDVLHLFTAAIWAGGLTGLLILLRGVHRHGGDATGPASVVARFSAWAGGTVAVLGASGLAMAFMIHRDWGSLFGSDHGRLLLVKLGLVGAALAPAAWNRLRLVPMIERAGDARAGLRRLRRLVAAEAAAVGLVIALTGALVSLSPDQAAPETEPQAAPEEFATELELGPDTAAVLLSPARTGPNTLTLELADGHPTEPEEAPTVHATLPEQDFGPIVAEMEAGTEPGSYLAELELPLAGEWELEIALRVSRFEEHRATVTVELP